MSLRHIGSHMFMLGDVQDFQHSWKIVRAKPIPDVIFFPFKSIIKYFKRTKISSLLLTEIQTIYRNFLKRSITLYFI